MLEIALTVALLATASPGAADWPSEPVWAGSFDRAYRAALFPLGFSPDGKLAWLAHFDDDILPSWKLVVSDLTTDRILDEVTWEEPDEPLPLDKLLKSEAARLRAVLDKHGVTVSAPKLSPLPIRHKGDALDVRVEGQEQAEKSSVFRVELVGASRRKTLARIEAEAAPKVVGGLLSPFEARAAVILVHSVMGFEGTRNTRFLVVGAHLTKGFEGR